MSGKIIISIVLALGVIFPDRFIKITEFWRYDKKDLNPSTRWITRLSSLIAIILIWLMPIIYG